MRLRLSTVQEVALRDGGVVCLAARDAALLAWLAIEGPTPRDRLGALLWPDSTKAQARTVLRQRLFKLKRALSEDVVTGASRLHLLPGLVHDLDGASHVLGELTFADAPEFDDWLARQRASRADRARDLLRCQAQALEDAGDMPGALRLAQALLREEPLSESAHQRVIRIHYLAGDRASALAAFNSCESMLEDELGVSPSSHTLALLETLERAAPRAAASAQRSLPMTILRPPVMVGRVREQQRLAQAWDARQVATILGEAGMGKSRLLRDFVDARSAIVVAVGRPGDANVPFATLARLLRAAADAGAGGLSDPALRRQLARVLPELDEPLPAEAPGHGARARLQQALVSHLRQVPGLQGVVVDDLHFADAASVEILHSLMTDESLAELRWAIALRPSEAGVALRNLRSALTEAAREAAVEVAPLDEAALVELIDTLDLDVLSSGLAPQLWRQTGGNPLFALETLKQAWLERRPGTADTALPRPLSVERLIDQRIARLSPAAAALAQLASIASVDFCIGMAESVLGVGALALSEALRELEAAQVLKGTAFVHDLVFDAVLRSVPGVIAAHTHSSVAAWLEAHGGEPARIAQHWIDGDSPVRATRWLGLAAQYAARALRNVEQLSFLERKANIELAAGDRGAAFASQFEVNRLALEVDCEATRAQARCDRLAMLATTPAQALQSLVHGAELAMRRWDDRLAESLATQAQAEAERLGDTEAAATCHILLVMSLRRLQRLHEALAHAQACVEWVSTHASLYRQGELHTYLGLLLGELGRHDEALLHHQRAIALSRRTGVPQHAITALGNMARTLGDAGRLDESRALYLQALQVLRMHEAPPANAAITMTNLGNVLLSAGHFAQALALLEEAERLAGEHYAAGKLPVLVVRLTCWERLGQWARVQQLAADPAVQGVDHAAMRVRLALATRSLRRARGERSDHELQATLAGLPPESGPSGRDTLLLELARTLPPAAALAQLDAVRARSLTNGFKGQVLAAHLYAAEAMTGIDAASARHHAQAALALAESHDHDDAYRAELWLICGKALLFTGDIALGRQMLVRGRDWVMGVAREHVPDEFRDSFLRRNPVNLELLSLVDKLDLRQSARHPGPVNANASHPTCRSEADMCGGQAADHLEA